MQTLFVHTLVFTASLALVASTPAAEPKRLTRAESFLGVHFDFHAGKDCKEIGKNTTREMIENVIRQVRPDYLQIDCKGHPGLSSYPTKVGNQAPGFVGDPLRLWRQVTAEHGVSLFMHYSGVWDSEAIAKNPSWAAVNADGKPNPNATSFFSPYADQLLVPQLRELAGDYGVDGMWVDGECWASVPDYGSQAIAAFAKATDIQTVPRKPGEPHWMEFLNFNREQFRRYLRYYITEVKKTHPKFQLCSNWAFTDHMPERVSAPVDFISGDYSPDDSVNSARLSGRYLTRQGKPWDLMAWSFSRNKDKNGNNQKTAVQLQREAALVVALGGGFQAYITQKRDGSIREERIPVMAEVAKFCRERQEFCHHAEQVPQIAVLYSTYAHYRGINGLFSRDPSKFEGILDALIEAQHSVELLGEHHLTGRMKEYPLIIIPEWPVLEPAFQSQLIEYAKAGGTLLIIGPQAAGLFSAELDAKLPSPKAPSAIQIEHGRDRLSLNASSVAAELGPKARPFGKMDGSPAAAITPLGKGRIAATFFPISRAYLKSQDPALRSFLSALVTELFPNPIVRVKGGNGAVDVIVNRHKGHLSINLVNTSGPHRSEPIVEAIEQVGPLTLEVRHPEPASVTLEPGKRPVNFKYSDGIVRFEVPRLAIHDIVAIHTSSPIW